jgi:hypothetical protein
MNLLDRSEIFEASWDIALPGAEAMDQPGQRVEFAGTVDLEGILIEHD